MILYSQILIEFIKKKKIQKVRKSFRWLCLSEQAGNPKRGRENKMEQSKSTTTLGTTKKYQKICIGILLS
jgi:hypothetical protein